MNPPPLTLTLLSETLAVCRLEPDDPVPSWADGPGFASVTRTDDELSVVCPERRVPDDVRAEGGWRAFRVEGPLDFSMVGILASLTGPLAAAGIPVFAVSTFDTDYLLVSSADVAGAVQVLRKFCRVEGASESSAGEDG